MKKYHDGFTLIELSIVLVIVALIISGIFVGRDLIRVSELRSFLSQMQTIETSVNAFKGKYNCLPGDCRSASALNLNTARNGINGSNGNGDGNVLGAEPWSLMLHMSNAELFAWNNKTPTCGQNLTRYYQYAPGFTNSTGKPVCIMASSMILSTTVWSPPRQPGGWVYAFSGALPTSDNGFLTPVDAKYIDDKVDDGLPQGGRLLAFGGGSSSSADVTYGIYVATTGPAGDTSNFCSTNDTPSQYNLLNVSRNAGSLCAVFWKASF